MSDHDIEVRIHKELMHATCPCGWGHSYKTYFGCGVTLAEIQGTHDYDIGATMLCPACKGHKRSFNGELNEWDSCYWCLGLGRVPATGSPETDEEVVTKIEDDQITEQTLIWADL